MQNSAIDRPLDPGEAFFCMADRVSCMNFVFFAERSGHLDTERIRAALDSIQEQNGLLQVKIVWTAESGLRFTHAANRPIDIQCPNVDANDWQSWIARELSDPFDEGAAPLVRCLYLRMLSPECSVLALCFHHSIADGRSGVELLRRLLDYIAAGAPSRASAAVTALPTMYEVFPARFRWQEQPEAAEQLADTLMGDYLRHGPLPPIPWLSRDAPGRTPKFIHLSFSPEVTHRLIARSRQQGTSVHGALCASQLLAQFRLQARRDPSTFLLSCPVDMRPYLEPIQPATPTGLCVSMISAAFAIDTTTEVWDLAREVIARTRLQLARGEGHLFFSLYGLDALPIAPNRMSRFKKAILATWPNTMVSNIGQVAAVARDPAVESISFVLCPMPYQTVFSAVSTYKDQLTLNLVYDEAKLTESNAKAIAAGMRDILLAAAGDSQLDDANIRK